MNEKDQFDAYIELANFHWTRRNNRRQAEMRFTLSLWALLAAATLYLKARPPEALLDSVLAELVILHFLTVRQIELRAWTDLETALFYVDQADNLLPMRAPPRQESKTTLEKSWWQKWTLGNRGSLWVPAAWATPTCLLAIVAYSLIG